MRLTVSLLACLSCSGLPSIAAAAPSPGCPIVPETAARAAPAPAGAVRFLSDSDPAYAYLEGLQDQAYRDNPKLLRWTGSANDQAKLRQIIDQLDKRASGEADPHPYREVYQELIAQMQRGMPTRYEDPNGVWLLCSAGLDVLTEVTKDSPGFVMPYLGTLPLGTLNATMHAVPGIGTKLVIVNVSLFPFAHELGKLGLATIQISAQGDKVAMATSDDYFNTLRGDPAYVRRVSMALEDFANRRQIVGQAPPRELDDPLLLAMDSALEAFVVAHEFGHIALRHAQQDRDPVLGLSQGGSLSDAALRRSWGEEAVADLYATAIVQRLAMRESRSAPPDSLKSLLGEFVRYAPVLFFQLSQIADEARYIHDHKAAPPQFSAADRATILKFLSDAMADQAGSLGNPSPPAAGKGQPVPAIVRQFGDHPPAWVRRALVRAYWRDHAPVPTSGVEVEFGTVAIGMGNHLEALWSDIAPLWVQILQKEPQK